MATQFTVSADEVEAALRLDPHFGDAPAEIFAIAGRLPGIIGVERASALTYADLLRVQPGVFLPKS